MKRYFKILITYKVQGPVNKICIFNGDEEALSKYFNCRLEGQLGPYCKMQYLDKNGNEHNSKMEVAKVERIDILEEIKDIGMTLYGNDDRYYTKLVCIQLILNEQSMTKLLKIRDILMREEVEKDNTYIIP